MTGRHAKRRLARRRLTRRSLVGAGVGLLLASSLAVFLLAWGWREDGDVHAAPTTPRPLGPVAILDSGQGAGYVPEGWPDQDTTGASGPLRRVPGRTVTKAGSVLENVRVEGTLTIRADEVTVRNVFVAADSYYGILIYGRGTVIESSTVAGTGPDTMAGIAAIEGGTFRASHIEVRGTEDGVRMADDCELRDSLVHRLAGDPDSHFDGVTADGGFTGWRVVHNTILNAHRQTGAVWVGDERYGPSSGVLQDNYLGGGGYTVYAGPGTGSGIHVVGNLFSTRFFRKGGLWGLVTRWDPRGNVWRDNIWADGPRRGHSARP